MLPGVGIGPELMGCVREVFHFLNVPVDFEIIEIRPDDEGVDDMNYALKSIKRNRVVIKS